MPAFRADKQRYPITCRLRYRLSQQGPQFWFEMIRPDMMVLEQAIDNVVAAVRGALTGTLFVFGNPDQ